MNIKEIATLISDISLNNGLILEANWDKRLASQFFRMMDIKGFLALNGIDVNNLKYAGEGGVGRVYTDGNKAVKITPDKDDYDISRQASKRCNHPNLVTIYDTRIVRGKYKNVLGVPRTFYMIVMDAVETKKLEGTPLGNAADYVGGYLDSSGQQLPFDPDEVTRDAIEYEEEDGTVLSDQEKKYMRLLFGIVQDIYDNCGLKYVDVGATNIGFKDGKLVLIDLGLSEF